MDQLSNKSIRYKELDALRGIAAGMVVLFHLTMGRPEAALGFKLGTTGVDLFFIISGFVISMSVDRVSSGIEFVINRASRLYPTYWTCVTLTFLIMSAYAVFKGNEIPMMSYLGNLTMFQYYLGVPDLDGPYWTMIVEMVFYLLMLALFLTGMLRHIMVIGSLIVSFSVGLFSISEWVPVSTLFELVPLLEFFPLFFAGILFYQMRTGQSRLLFYLLILGCFVSQIVLFPVAGKSMAFIDQFEYAVMLSVFFGAFILFVNNKLNFVVNKALLFLGKISFALYLVHQYLLLGHLLPFLTNRLGINFWISALGICLPVAVLIATVVTFVIEIPSTRKMRTRLQNLVLKLRLAQ